jgi:hypothetical protein
MAARTIAGRIASGETTRENLHRLTLEFAAQQDAKGSRNTQFVENPCRHFDGRGRWKGPFQVPSKPETAAERIKRLNPLPSDFRDGAIEHVG